MANIHHQYLTVIHSQKNEGRGMKGMGGKAILSAYLGGSAEPKPYFFPPVAQLRQSNSILIPNRVLKSSQKPAAKGLIIDRWLNLPRDISGHKPDVEVRNPWQQSSRQIQRAI